MDSNGMTWPEMQKALNKQMDSMIVFDEVKLELPEDKSLYYTKKEVAALNKLANNWEELNLTEPPPDIKAFMDSLGGEIDIKKISIQTSETLMDIYISSMHAVHEMLAENDIIVFKDRT